MNGPFFVRISEIRDEICCYRNFGPQRERVKLSLCTNKFPNPPTVRTISLDGEKISFDVSLKEQYTTGRPLNFVPAAAVRASNAQKSNHNKSNQQHRTTGLVSIIPRCTTIMIILNKICVAEGSASTINLRTETYTSLKNFGITGQSQLSDHPRPLLFCS